MQVKVKQKTNRIDALNYARNTVGKSELDKEPSEEFWEAITLAEHSPIRSVIYEVKMIDIPSFVSVHFVRHKFGVEHWVKTQRSDRTGIDRKKLFQDQPVDHTMELNAQAFINISKERLCRQADKETIKVWKAVLDELEKIDPTLRSRCVRKCVYRAMCPEINCCGFNKTIEYQQEMNNYRQ